jgi:diguanylate cyclase (GGDEF)-like protein
LLKAELGASPLALNRHPSGADNGEVEDSAELRRQALLDLEKRTFLGSQAYLPCWLVIAVSTGLVRAQPGFTAATAAGFAAVAAGRLMLHRNLTELATRRPRLAGVAFRSFLLAGGGLFGTLAGLSLAWSPLHPAQMTLITLSAVICTVATMALAIDPWARFGMPVIMLLPVVAGLLTGSAPPDPLVALLIPAFALYLFSTSQHVHDDYWVGLRAGELLRRRAIELERLSSTDPLTQIANRLHFDRRLGEEWARAVRDGLPLSLLLADVDHFKRINDRHGHPFGDRCLVAIAETLTTSVLRRSDLVARYGGEEFVVLLPNTSTTDARGVAERLRTAIAGLALDDGGVPVPVTISLGTVTVVPQDGTTTAQAIAVADQALYRAKAAGRNRVVLGRKISPLDHATSP